jgi:NADPH:quinone reductase-like Zn-dependent oxidoreductase
MQVLGYDTGPIRCRAAFTSDFAVPADMPIQQLVNNVENERPSMDIRPGMRHKYMPLRFDPATGAHLVGGRYLFDNWDDVADYVRFTSTELEFEPGVKFWDRPFFLGIDKHAWHVVGAHDFTPMAGTHYVNRLERFSYTRADAENRLAKAWPKIRAAAEAQGLASAWLLVQPDEHQIGIVTIADRVNCCDDADTASQSLAALEHRESLARLLPLELAPRKVFDRTSLILSLWLPRSRDAGGVSSAFPTFPVHPLPDGDTNSSRDSSLPTAPAVVRERAGGETMQAIVLEKFGGLDSLVYTDIPKPLPKNNEVVIEVRGFGINHAELHMRRGEWAEAAEVSGIECVGIVDSCPGGEFPVGAKVAALMGGLGRTINGSYAEYTRVRAANVALIDSDLPWSQLAALPETFATAWTCLFRNLKLSAGQTVVIRGATSSFGQAAVKMAVAAGATVIATARKRERFGLLEELGAARVELESRTLAAGIAEAKHIDAVLDLVGNSTILDSLGMLRRDGTACLAGWLGGLDPIGDFNPLLRMASGVNWSFFGSFVFGSPGFPLSDVPLQDIAAQVAAGGLNAAPERVFSFDEIREAHRVMEAGEAGGKMVVVMD